MFWTPGTREMSNYTVTLTFNTERVDEKEFVSGAMRLGFYAAIIAIFIMIIALILKLMWNWDVDERGERDARANETSRLLSSTEKITFSFYGSSSEEDLESGKLSGRSLSSDDLYDEKICAICYDDQRSCLFVPCGHCITCYTCTKRIINDEINTCPICRTIIHKVRRLRIL